MAWIAQTVRDESPYSSTAKGSPYLSEILKMQARQEPFTAIYAFLSSSKVDLDLDGSPYPTILGNSGVQKQHSLKTIELALAVEKAVASAKQAWDAKDPDAMHEASLEFECLPEVMPEDLPGHDRIVCSKGGMFSQTITGLDIIAACKHKGDMSLAIAAAAHFVAANWKDAVEETKGVAEDVRIVPLADVLKAAATDILEKNLAEIQRAETAMLDDADPGQEAVGAYKRSLGIIKAVPEAFVDKATDLPQRTKDALEVGERYYSDVGPDPDTAALFGESR
jgi:hypothetical protein